MSTLVTDLPRAVADARIMPAMLRRAREARGVTNGEMALRLGVAHTVVSRLEAQYAPRIDEGHLTKWAGALGMTLPELLAFAQTT